MLKNALPVLFKTHTACLIWGRHGIGKSAVVRQVCDESGYKYFDLRLGNVTEGDLLGLPTIEDGSTSFAMPDWLQSLIRYCQDHPDSGAVIFFDEINRGRREVLQSVFQMVLDHKIHTVVFPDNLYVVAACNPNDDNYVVTDLGDEAFMDRFCHIALQPSVSEWLAYETSKGMSPERLAFISKQPDLLESSMSPCVIDRKPSRRSHEKIDAMWRMNLDRSLFTELSYGLIGKVATIAFLESLKSLEVPIPAQDILNKYDKKLRKRVLAYAASSEESRSDLLKATNDNLIAYIEGLDKAGEKVPSDAMASLVQYMYDTPTDLMIVLFREIFGYCDIAEYLTKEKDFRAYVKRIRGESTK
jgi:hypothetical protein